MTKFLYITGTAVGCTVERDYIIPSENIAIIESGEKNNSVVFIESKTNYVKEIKVKNSMTNMYSQLSNS